MPTTINIAKQFSVTPNARYKSDGKFSGELFYDNHLKSAFQQALDKKEKLHVILDGTEGYATSFLDEAFSRLSAEFGAEQVWTNLQLTSEEEPDWIDEIHDYIFGLHNEEV